MREDILYYYEMMDAIRAGCSVLDGDKLQQVLDFVDDMQELQEAEDSRYNELKEP